MDGIDKKFEEVNRLFDGRESVKMGEGKRLSLDIVSGLTDILKKINQKSPNNNLVDRVCRVLIIILSIGFVNLLMRLVKKKMLYGAYLSSKGMAKFCSHS